MSSIFSTTKTTATHLKPLALLTALTLALSACGVDSKPNLTKLNNNASNNNGGGTTQTKPTIEFLTNFTSSTRNLSETDTLTFEVTLKENAKEVIKSNNATASVDYTIVSDNVASDKKTGTVTFDKNNLDSKKIKVQLISDGKANTGNPFYITLSNAKSTPENLNLIVNDDLTNKNRLSQFIITNTDAGVFINDASVPNKGDDDMVVAVPVVISKPATKDTKVNFEIIEGTAKQDTHYKQPNEKSVTIKKGETQATIDITLIGDRVNAPKSFQVKLTSTDTGTAIFTDKNTATVSIDSYVAEAPKLGKLNDTGVTGAGLYPTGNVDACSAAGVLTQDCHVGRDSTANDNTDGHAGFSFTKLDSSGKPLNHNALQWACIQDNVTGLIWETKTFHADNNQKDFRDATWQYTYYNSATGMGNKDTGKGVLKDKDVCGNDQHICTTEQYASSVNATALCGVKNWRLPSRMEIFGVMNLSSKQPEVVLHKGWLYPNDIESAKIPYSIWTNTPAPDRWNNNTFGEHIWTAYNDGTFGSEKFKSRFSSNSVILVSNGKTSNQ